LPSDVTFDPGCRLCPRLVEIRQSLRDSFPRYHNAPVAPFGDPDARLLIVGLAPGMHGANASGRPFTGDFAGILLYETLYELGLSSAPVSVSADDPLTLIGCRITNAVKCLPPGNKPTTAEIKTCNRFLRNEIALLDRSAVVLALGAIAHSAVLRARTLQQSSFKFAHGAVHDLPGGSLLIDSYHCSRYNTQTGRLTKEMFLEVLRLTKSKVMQRT